MDNLTHSLAGLAVGELMQRALAPEPTGERQSSRRRLLLLAGWAASNCPDLDLLLAPLLAPPLGYLLQHRGYSHTVLWLMPQALLLIGMLWLCWPAARAVLNNSARARAGLGAAIGLGLLLHLAMDSLNSYGVHPFAPFDARWRYGDMTFIVEPMFWIAFGLPLAGILASPPYRLLLVGALLGAPLWFGLKGYLHWGSQLALFAAALGLGVLASRGGAPGKRALQAGFALSLALVALQAIGSVHARRIVAAQLARIDPASRLLDVALTAFPANPVCWSFVSVEADEAADRYRLRRGVLSLAPGLLAPAACPDSLAHGRAQRALSPAIGALSESTAPLSVLRARARDDCHLRAWLRFARAPLLSGSRATDLRFGGPHDVNFTTIDLSRFERADCPRQVPGWDYPRADLIWPAGAGAR
jgi:inner membrane protein